MCVIPSRQRTPFTVHHFNYTLFLTKQPSLVYIVYTLKKYVFAAPFTLKKEKVKIEIEIEFCVCPPFIVFNFTF